MDEHDEKRSSPVDRDKDNEGSVLGTIGTLAFVLSWPLFVLIGLGILYGIFRLVVG